MSVKEEIKRVGVVGLGLIGGSIAKAIKQNTECKVYGFDILDTVTKKAVLVGAIDEVLVEESLSNCDLVILALYPGDAVRYVEKNAGVFKKDAVVLDCCGVKKVVCDALEPVAQDRGFVFMGGHPMAGLEHSGFAHSKKALFQNASMILTPGKGTTIQAVDSVKKLFLNLGFTNIQISTPEEHDKMIAFTSQLAHVVSSAYIKSPTATMHKGFSAGSYKDLTRVAKLNEAMWTELFLDNSAALTVEIDGIMERLAEYRDAIKGNDAPRLNALLKEGREKKAIIDGEKF